jgi:hypothetical protein
MKIVIAGAIDTGGMTRTYVSDNNGFSVNRSIYF